MFKKSIILLLLIGFITCGCEMNKKDNTVNNFINIIENSKSYKVTGVMEIFNDEEKFVYDFKSMYLKDDNYKIELINKSTNHKQVILKNGEDVYVITPSLNKSFKFQSNWPNNSSQVYLLNSIVKDLKEDTEKIIKKINNEYVIKSKVYYPNNEDLIYQKVYLSNNQIKKIEVYDKNDLVKIKVEFNKVKLDYNAKTSDFNIDDYIKENDNNSEEKTETSSTIDNIIYPLYIPSNTYLMNNENVDTDDGNRIILTFGGSKNFVLIEEKAIRNDDMAIVPVYGEPFLLSETVAALSSNSLSWYANDISYYLASTDLSVKEMKDIANSLGNSTLVANTK